MASWAPLLHELVATELPERDHAEKTQQLAGQLRQAGTPILRLVEALGPFLTTDDDPQRARATSVLAEVVAAVPAAAAGEGDVVHLSQFFTSRLTDWPAVRGALKGCLALLSRRGSAAPARPALAEVEEAAAVEMMRACVSHVFIRALAQQDRTVALRLVTAAMRGYGAALLDAGLDLFEYLVSSVDGEKDPRCLLLCFEAVRCLLALYHRQPDTSLCHERLEEGAEELFEVLACYFPVTFTPPPNDPNRISREDLAAGLEAALVAEPLFAPYLVPLACEKLSSTLRQAKLDSLSLLGACAEGYGPAPLAGHVSTLWSALRPELLAPAGEGLLPADVPAAAELAAAAATCLARCVAAFQSGGGGGGGRGGEEEVPAGARLADAVLQDSSLQDMMACIQSPGSDAAVHRRSVLRAQAGARVAEALCRAGGATAAQALGQLLPPLLALAAARPAEGSSGGWQAQCLAWCAVLGMLAAAAEAPPSAPPAGVDGELARQVVAAAASALEAAAAALAPAVGAEGEEAEEAAPGPSAQRQPQAASWPLLPGDCTQQRAATLQLAALAALFGDPRQAAALPGQDVEAAVASVLHLLSAPCASASTSAQQAAAVAPLAALARSAHAAALSDAALPRLVAAAGRPQTAAAALAALQALAAASSGLQLDIVVALDQALQQQLPAAAGDPAGSAAQLMQQLLRAAAGIASAPPAHGGAAEPAAAACFLQLGQHLLDAAQLLPAQAAAAVGAEVQAACGELAYHAMRGAAAEQQQPLAAAAAAAVMQRGHAHLAAPGGLQATVCCALLVPLRQEAVRGLAGQQPAAPLVQRLVQLAQAQPDGSPAGHWAALAAAALLNKWDPADSDSAAACSSAVLQRQLYPACGLSAGGGSDAGGAACLPAPAPSSWRYLAAVGRGLAMRGSREADAAVGRAIAALDAAAQRWQAVQAEGGGPLEAAGSEAAAALQQLAAGAQAAAHFLEAALDGGAAGAGLSKQSHAVCKPLWQQRLYTAAAARLLPLLEGSLRGASAARQAAAAGGEGAAPLLASPVLLLALACLLCTAPSGVLQQEQRRMLPWMLQCLAALQRGPLADGELLLSLLLLVSDALMSSAGKQQAEAELLPRLVPALLELTAYRPVPAVRETALQCLLVLVDLPYTCLHPYRRAVAASLAAAVDDNRRGVRLQAARCRQAWTAS